MLYHLQRGYARGRDRSILQVVGLGSELDAGDDEPNAVIGPRVSPRPETGAHDCGSGGERRYPICASGGNVEVLAEVDNGLNSLSN